MSQHHVVLENSSGTITDKRLIKALIEKWEPLLEGLTADTPHERYKLGTTALVYETQARHLGSLNEETRTTNVGYFTKFIFPMLRRVFPNLFAHELVSVQPITGPQGIIFYLDYIFGSSKGGVTAGQVFPRDFNKSYTSEEVDGEIVATGDGANYGAGGSPISITLAWTPVRKPDANRGHKVLIREVDSTSGATVQEGAFLASGVADTGSDITAGTLNFTNGALAGVRFAATPTTGNPIRVFYHYDGEFNVKIPEMRLDVRQANIVPDNFRMKALWSAEAAEDLRALQGIEAETEILAASSQEMALEIDRLIINDLFLASTGTADTFDRIPPTGIAEVDHLRSIITRFSTVSNQIHKKTLRAPANWIVTSPEISALIEQLTTHGDFRPIWVNGTQSPYGPVDAPRPLSQHGQFGIYKAGTLHNKWVIYVDPFFTPDFSMLGLKGRTYLEAGYVWAPYVLLAVSGTFLDPSDGGLRKLIRSRFGRKLLRPEYYGQLRVTNL
ncbi:MAG TPA: hypothetical protein VM537_19845 [Anaerolineae bacterium]|nr:hypothetical protein [Anaerolineae bacterium]